MKLTIKIVEKIYFKRLLESGYKPNTIRCRKSGFKIFFRFISSHFQPDFDLRNFNRENIVEFLSWLRTSGKERVLENEMPSYDGNGVANILFLVRSVFTLLVEKKLLLVNPVKKITVKKPEKTFRVKLSVDDMESLLNGTDVSATSGLRDRALLELLYSSGLRPGEPGKLKISDVDLTERLAVIRETKVGKDRIVPITQRAVTFLIQQIEGRNTDEYLFPVKDHGVTQQQVNFIFLKWAKLTGVYRPGLTAHSIRHSTASHLLARGADLRYVQELLGHASIQSTNIYTTELVDGIKKIYKTYHPRENLLYKEVDETFLAKIQKLKSDLEISRRKRDGNRKVSAQSTPN